MTKVDLSLDGLGASCGEHGSKIVMSIQGYLIESVLRSMSAPNLRSKGSTFDKENDQASLQLLSKAGGVDKMMSLDRALAEYKDELTHLG